MSFSVELGNITKTYADGTGTGPSVLRNLELTITPASTVAIIGRSGSGKSTLLNLLGLLDKPSTGEYKLNGVETGTLNSQQLASVRGKHIGFVFQQFHLLGHYTALQNVAEPLLLGNGIERRHRFERANELLESVGMADRAHRKPSTLSGGEMQRVALARALARNPTLVLADEPTGSLDVETARQVLDLILTRSAESGATVVLVTHDREVASRADIIYELADGRLHNASAIR